MSSKKKLLLVYPNFRWQDYNIFTMWDLNPATLCLLAAMVKDLVEVKIFDAQFYDLTPEQFKDEIRNYRPDYIGISLMASEYHDILDITANAVKEVDSNIIVIAGGVHVTINYKYIMKNKNIDYCVRGEGEYPLRGLMEYFTSGSDMPLEGLIYRNDGDLVVQRQAFVEDMAKLPWPDYELIDFNAYLNKTARFGPTRSPEFPGVRMSPTRGCPFGCSFCQTGPISGKKVRARDPEGVVNELVFLKEKYGIKSIVFDNDNILMGSNNFAREFFALMIKRKLNLKWICPGVALFLLDDELLDLMRDSGCIGVNVAIESGNERVLRDIVNKPIKDLSKVPAIINNIKSRGMFCLANFIIGFPQETWDEIRETISFAEHCGADYVKIFFAVPLYGTKLYKMAVESGAIAPCGDEKPKVNWRYSQISSKDWTAKDVSILRAYEWDRINFSKERINRTAQIWGMSIDELNEIRKKTRDSLTF